MPVSGEATGLRSTTASTTRPPVHTLMHPLVKNAIVGVGSWAAICLVVVLPRSARISATFGGGWTSVLFVYGLLFVGGMAILPIFMSLDRIKSEGMKFAAQMIACLLLAVVALIGIGIYTF